MKKGCAVYFFGTVVIMTMSGFLLSQGDNISSSTFVIVVIMSLVVAFYALKAVCDPLKEKYNPNLIDAIFWILILMSVFVNAVWVMKYI